MQTSTSLSYVSLYLLSAAGSKSKTTLVGLLVWEAVPRASLEFTKT